MKFTKFKQKIGSLIVLGAVLLSAPLAAFANTSGFPFTDVPQDHWARGYVEFVHSNQIMNGITDTRFEPNGALNRGMAVATLFRAHHGRIANATDSRVNPFSDVETERWYAPYVTWAYGKGIVEGHGGNLFAPSGNLTREQFAVMLYRFAEAEGLDTNVPAGFRLDQFTDSGQISTWATAAVRWANYNGILMGMTTTTIAPGATAIRAQGAALLYRFLTAFALQADGGVSAGFCDDEACIPGDEKTCAPEATSQEAGDEEEEPNLAYYLIYPAV